MSGFQCAHDIYSAATSQYEGVGKRTSMAESEAWRSVRSALRKNDSSRGRMLPGRFPSCRRRGEAAILARAFAAARRVLSFSRRSARICKQRNKFEPLFCLSSLGLEHLTESQIPVT